MPVGMKLRLAPGVHPEELARRVTDVDLVRDLWSLLRNRQRRWNNRKQGCLIALYDRSDAQGGGARSRLSDGGRGWWGLSVPHRIQDGPSR